MVLFHVRLFPTRLVSLLLSLEATAKIREDARQKMAKHDGIESPTNSSVALWAHGLCPTMNASWADSLILPRGQQCKKVVVGSFECLHPMAFAPAKTMGLAFGLSKHQSPAESRIIEYRSRPACWRQCWSILRSMYYSNSYYLSFPRCWVWISLINCLFLSSSIWC